MSFIKWLFDKDTWNTSINEYALGVFTLMGGTTIIVILSLGFRLLSVWWLVITIPIGLFWVLHGIWRDR